MDRTAGPPRIYRFGSFELSVDAAELRKNGIRLKLQDQPFHILCALLEHPGELVTREQLRQQLWPDGTFVDFEHGLNTAIKKLRDVLSDEADNSRYIETVPRKGYRFIASLNGERTQVPERAFPPPPQRRSRTLLAIAAITLIALVALLVYLVQWRPTPPLVFATRQLTFTGDLSHWRFYTIQTDGRRVYYSKIAQTQIYSIPVHGGGETSFATSLREPMLLHISPDGSNLLVREYLGLSGGIENRVWVVPTNGSPARRLGDIEARFAAWSPDGKAIAFANKGAVYLTQDEGSSYRKLFDVPGEVTFLRWSPDGRKLDVTVLDPKTMTSSLWESRSGTPVRPLLPKFDSPGDLCCGDWTRDGRYFFFRRTFEGRTEYWYIDESRFSLRTGRPLLLATGGSDVRAATASPLENKIFVASFQLSAMLVKFDLHTRKAVPFLPGFSGRNPSFSPDKRWMAVCQYRNDESILWRARSDGTEWLQLTDPRLWVYSAQFSPDGKQIIFMGQWPNRPWKVYVIASEGGALKELGAPIVSQADPNWIPDGQSVIFGQPPRYFAEPHDPRAIYSFNLRTNALTKLPGSEGWFSPRLSPDGRQVLALSIDEHKLAVYDLASNQWRVLIDDPQNRASNPFWSFDGSWVYTNVNDRVLTRIRVRDGTREDILSFDEVARPPTCFANGFTPDNSIIVNCTRPNSDIYSLEYN